MPTFPVLPRFDVAINYTVNGRLCTNVACYSAPAVAPTTAIMQAVADSVGTIFGNPLKGWLTTDNKFDGVEVRYLSATQGRYAVSAANAGVGSRTPTELGGVNARIPTAEAVIIQKLGDGPPKRANGTVYLAALDEGDVDADHLTEDALELAQTYANAFETNIVVAGGEGTPCVHSRTANLLYSIFNTNVKVLLGYISRRRPKR